MNDHITQSSATGPSATPSAGPCETNRRIIIVALLLMLIGAAIRLHDFAAGSSLWIDEAVLADNIITRDYQALTQPLDHHQLAPVGYLWLTRLATQLFGTDERVLRLVSLIAGLLTLPALCLLGRRLLPPIGVLILLALGCFSLSLIDYSNEVKPYSLDALATTVLLWLGLRTMQRDWDARSLAALALIAAAAVWLSLTAVFVAAGVFIAALIMNRRTPSRLLPIVLAGALPGISFLLHFLLFLRPSMGNQAMADFWAHDFVPLPPRSLKQVEWFVTTPLHYFADPAGFRAIGLALAAALAGIALWWRDQRRALLLIAVPIVLLLVASALRKYPTPTAPQAGDHWYGRLILFTLPIALCAIAASAGHLYHTAGRAGRAVAVLIVLLLLAHPVLDVARSIKGGAPGQGDVRSALHHLASHQQPGDVVYPNWPMRQLAAYYRHRIDLGDPQKWLATHPVLVRSMLTDDAWTRLNDWANWEKQLLELRGQRVWLLLSHEPSAGSRPDEKFLVALMRQHGEILDEVKSEEASLYLVKLRDDAGQ